ncbi:Subtilisin-like protease SBT5.3, partial [Mucuna pruriens]
MLFYGKPYTCPKSFSLLDFNYPTITIPKIDPGHSLNVSRTVTNVGSPSMYEVRIEAPPQILVSVEPRILSFKRKGEKKEFRVTLTLKPQTNNITNYVFGWLTWSDHTHSVRSPIAVNITHSNARERGSHGEYDIPQFRLGSNILKLLPDAHVNQLRPRIPIPDGETHHQSGVKEGLNPDIFLPQSASEPASLSVPGAATPTSP